MIISDIRYSRCRSCSSLRICASTVTSSAVVGSSAISTRGLQDSAMAIITRCRMPPLNWNGYSSTRCAGAAMPTRAINSMARRLASCLPTSSWCRIASTICAPMV